MPVKRLRGALLLSLLFMLGGCNMVLLHPDGYVARQQSDIMISTTIIIALIVVPVLIAIGVIAWRYRASNKNAHYDARWAHSPQIELMVWAAPLLIIIAVGAVSWTGTHQTDPYRRLDKIGKYKPVAANVKPLEVDVVSLRWKWLFFYPRYNIATVNELAAPLDTPIHFKLTSDTMMDSFFVPALAGQIYTMPGMQTQLHGVIHTPGDYKGFSANYSGGGFTDMRFTFHGMPQKAFDSWVARVRASSQTLDRKTYDKLKQPSRDAPVRHYARFNDSLYQRILNRCVDPGQTCMNQMKAVDARHGQSSASAHHDSQANASAASTDHAKTLSAHAAAMH